MTEDLKIAKQILRSCGCTCVFVKRGRVIFTSSERGVEPIYKALKKHLNELWGSSLADKVIGKGAAFLAVQAKVKELFTNILSEEAKMVLENNGIKFYYNNLVPNILNRQGNDLCPVEKLTKDINESQQALSAIRGFLKDY
ncbi:MAG: DUF1893 domain-containing protein [Clostridia bacterium]|nr:DUF1893 domain-containing protein [Clostridia bacterium]MDD4047871.1 DUF1893 domain-containing protein [Clostridia bacterium]